MLRVARAWALMVSFLLVLVGGSIFADRLVLSKNHPGVVLVAVRAGHPVRLPSIASTQPSASRSISSSSRSALVMLALVNEARISSGLQPIAGMSASLNKLAYEGAADFEDPRAPGSPWRFEGSVWAKNLGPAQAVRAWLNEDGWEGRQTINVACTSPVAPDCGAHRRILLSRIQPKSQGRLLAGVAAVRVGNTWSEAMVLAIAPRG
jgi:hypothetical protein